MAPPAPWWRRLGGQFKDLVIWILIAAAVISGVAGETVDAVVILAIVVLNGLLGFLQEERAGRALAALRQMAAPRAKVIRDGRLQVIPARDLVPGDRIELEAGRPRPRRRPPHRRRRVPRRGGGADRRISPRGQAGGRRPARRHAAGRPAEHGLHGHDRRDRGDRRRHRGRHRAWTRNWAGSPACSAATSPSRRRCSGGWRGWAGR